MSSTKKKFMSSVYREGEPGVSGDLEKLLLEGLSSGEPQEATADYWNELISETDAIVESARKQKFGSQAELEDFLMDGLNSGKPEVVEEWDCADLLREFNARHS